jgi:hypothetical protein
MLRKIRYVEQNQNMLRKIRDVEKNEKNEKYQIQIVSGASSISEYLEDHNRSQGSIHKFPQVSSSSATSLAG